MKRLQINHLALLIAGFIVIMSCTRNDSSPRDQEDQLIQIQKETAVEAVIQKTIDQIDKEISMLEQYNYNPSATKGEETDPCKPVVTVETPPDKKFPKTITLDYGEGCLSSDKTFRAGKVIVHITGPYWEKNTVRQSKLVDYHYNDLKIEGQRHEINKGTNDKGYYIFEVKHQEKIWNEKGELLTERDWNRTRVYNRGDLKVNSDDEVWVTGSAKVKTNGKELKKEITIPLYRKITCQHFQEGAIVTYAEKQKVGMLDYGVAKIGECDDKAVWTNKDGNTNVITLKSWVNIYSVKP
jgi:hypothetical protein